MVEMAMFNVQRAITPKLVKPGLRFISSASRFIVLHICVKFRENISGRYQGYGADMNDGSADGRTKERTNTQNFGGFNMIPVAGHKMVNNLPRISNSPSLVFICQKRKEG